MFYSVGQALGSQQVHHFCFVQLCLVFDCCKLSKAHSNSKPIVTTQHQQYHR